MDGSYSPALIVGIGGTGANVLRNIKWRMQMYSGVDTNPVKLLLIDGASGEQQRVAPEVYFSNDEFFDLSLDYDPPALQNQLDAANPSYDHINWVPSRTKYQLPLKIKP